MFETKQQQKRSQECLDILDVISKTVLLPPNVTQHFPKQCYSIALFNVGCEKKKGFNMINSQVSLLIYRDDDPLTTRVVGTEGA